MKTIVCVCCFWAGPRNMRWWPEWRPLLTQPHYWWKSTAGDYLTSCSDTPLTPLIWFHNLVENLCRIGLRIVSLETNRRANWKEFVGIGRQCAFPEIWLETLSSFKFSVETFGTLWLLSITHHPQYENFRQHKRFLFVFFISTQLHFSFGKIGGSTDFNWHWTTLSHWSFCAKGGRSVARSTRKFAESHLKALFLAEFSLFFSWFGWIMFWKPNKIPIHNMSMGKF